MNPIPRKKSMIMTGPMNPKSRINLVAMGNTCEPGKTKSSQMYPFMIQDRPMRVRGQRSEYWLDFM